MLIKRMALKLAKMLGTRPDLKPTKKSGAKQKLKPNLKTKLKKISQRAKGYKEIEADQRIKN